MSVFLDRHLGSGQFKELLDEADFILTIDSDFVI